MKQLKLEQEPIVANGYLITQSLLFPVFVSFFGILVYQLFFIRLQSLYSTLKLTQITFKSTWPGILPVLSIILSFLLASSTWLDASDIHYSVSDLFSFAPTKLFVLDGMYFLSIKSSNFPFLYFSYLYGTYLFTFFSVYFACFPCSLIRPFNNLTCKNLHNNTEKTDSTLLIHYNNIQDFLQHISPFRLPDSEHLSINLVRYSDSLKNPKIDVSYIWMQIGYTIYSTNFLFLSFPILLYILPFMDTKTSYYLFITILLLCTTTYLFYHDTPKLSIVLFFAGIFIVFSSIFSSIFSPDAHPRPLFWSPLILEIILWYLWTIVSYNESIWSRITIGIWMASAPFFVQLVQDQFSFQIFTQNELDLSFDTSFTFVTLWTVFSLFHNYQVWSFSNDSTGTRIEAQIGLLILSIRRGILYLWNTLVSMLESIEHSFSQFCFKNQLKPNSKEKIE